MFPSRDPSKPDIVLSIIVSAAHQAGWGGLTKVKQTSNHVELHVARTPGIRVGVLVVHRVLEIGGFRGDVLFDEGRLLRNCRPRSRVFIVEVGRRGCRRHGGRRVV